jgi:hypothetical protein
MIRAEFRWWIWLIAALGIYVAWRSPSGAEFAVVTTWHIFAAVGTGIGRLLADLAGQPH